MKKLTKVLGATLCLTSMLGVLAGCGNDNAPSQGAADDAVKVAVFQYADHPSLDNCREGFIQGLGQAGYKEGDNLVIDYQNAHGEDATAAQIAQQLASSDADLICAIATPAALQAYNAAEGSGIPVVYTAVSDPILAGLANEDGSNIGNITGTSDALPLEKQVAMIREFLPDAKKLGVMYTTSEPNSESHIAILKEIAPKYGFELVLQGVNETADIPMACDSILNNVDCLTNLTDNNVVNSLDIIIEKANAKNIPVFGSEVEQLKKGCLASESIDYIELGVLTGEMAADVLDGASAEETKYVVIEDSALVVNPKAAEQLGITIPEAYAEAESVNTGE